ncbi:MAG TPA: NifU family protein [Gemmatimonadaceae bacterium]|jgi:Fe-S cluster biogenesis protein NfuA|nr:NifU family protein [Gemmatimonadaceae bacterium]
MLGRGARNGRDIDDRIRDTLNELRPLLHIDEATIELVRFDVASGVALLRVEGDCRDCEMSAANMIEGIAAHLRARVPEVKDVQRTAG